MKKTLFTILILSALAATAHALILGPSGASTVTYAPNAPTLSSVSSASATSLSLVWSYGTTDASHSAATSVSVYRGTSAGAESGTPVATGVTSSPWADTGLTTSQPYYYYLKAVNTAGSSVASNEMSGTPTATVYAPNAPTIGTATAGNASASVAFTPGVVDGTHSAATSYTATSNPGSITGTGASSPISVTGLTNGTPYTFTVTASNSAGPSAASAASNSVTPSAGTGTYTFDGSAGTGVGAYDSFFTAALSGAGYANLEGSGNLHIRSTSTSDAAVVYRTSPVTYASTRTYKVKAKVIQSEFGASTGVTALGLSHSTGFQYPSTSGDGYRIGEYIVYELSGSLYCYFRYFDASNAAHESDTVTGWPATSQNPVAISSNTYYWFYIYTTATGWSIQIKDAADSANVIAKTSEIPWSSTKTPSGGESAYIYMGEKYTFQWNSGLYIDTYIEQ